MAEPDQAFHVFDTLWLQSQTDAPFLSGIRIEDLPGSIVLIEQSGTLWYMNKAAEHLLGSSFFSIQEILSPIGALPAGAAAWSFQGCDGNQKTIEVEWVTLEQGGRKFYLVSLHDLSALLHEMEDLRVSEYRFRTIADFTYDWEYWVSPAGDLVYVSPACKRITGYGADEFFRQPQLLNRIVHPEDLPAYTAHLMDEQRDPRVYSLDFRIIDREGRERWIGHKCQPAYDPAGTYLGQRISNRDITSTKNAEQALSQLNQDLETRVAERTAQLRQEISVRMRVENEINTRLRAETTLAKISAAFIQVNDFTSAVNQVLRSIGQLTNANRVALYCTREQGRSFECSHEWCNARIVSQTGGQKAISGEIFTKWFEDYQDVKALHVENLANIPPGYLPGMDISTGEPSKTLILLPINSNSELLGFLSLENIPASSYWHEHGLSLLGIVAQIIGSSLERARMMETLEQRVVDRTRELKALYEVAAITGQPLQIEEMLHLLLIKVLHILDQQAGFIHILDEDERSFRLVSSQCISTELLGLVDDPKWIQCIRNLLDHCQGQIMTVELGENMEWFFDLLARKYRSFIGLPIRVQGSVIGLISILGETTTTLTLDQKSLLAAIMDQVSIAVDSARLRKHSEEAAIMKERERLARELHDSVTQSLYSLTLMARGWQRGVGSVHPEEIHRWLERIGEISNQALKEMRLLVYDLLPNTLRKDGLGGALKRRLDTVEGRLNIATTLEVDSRISLPAKTEQELYRIAQEALNNILKHSEATQANVSLQKVQEFIELEISDNGNGFDPDDIKGGPGLGIINMRTRAERLGGQFSLRSTPHVGTRILVSLKAQDQPDKYQSNE